MKYIVFIFLLFQFTYAQFIHPEAKEVFEEKILDVYEDMSDSSAVIRAQLSDSLDKLHYAIMIWSPQVVADSTFGDSVDYGLFPKFEWKVEYDAGVGYFPLLRKVAIWPYYGSGLTYKLKFVKFLYFYKTNGLANGTIRMRTYGYGWHAADTVSATMSYTITNYPEENPNTLTISDSTIFHEGLPFEVYIDAKMNDVDGKAWIKPFGIYMLLRVHRKPGEF